MKKKGFTLVELLVVIAIIALLMGILMPALARVRQIAFRMVCGTNLSGIGKAMVLYANEYDDEFPRAGGRTSQWSNKIADWAAVNRYAAYQLGSDGTGGFVTITSSFYLLIKYTEVTPSSFVCKSDGQVTEFNPIESGTNLEVTQLWDFGPTPADHCSYAYHMPYGLYALTSSSEPGLAVAADRNPWIPGPGYEPDAANFTNFNPAGGREYVSLGNSPSHQNDSQNVLFVDIHVNQEKSSACGVNDDNIYTFWGSSTANIQKGTMPAPNTQPTNRADSYLVNDMEEGGVTPTQGRQRNN